MSNFEQNKESFAYSLGDVIKNVGEKLDVIIANQGGGGGGNLALEVGGVLERILYYTRYSAGFWSSIDIRIAASSGYTFTLLGAKFAILIDEISGVSPLISVRHGLTPVFLTKQGAIGASSDSITSEGIYFISEDVVIDELELLTDANTAFRARMFIRDSRV